MSIAEKLTTIAENQKAVYDAGKQAEYDAFWDSFTTNGTRTEYNFAFSKWAAEEIVPPSKITPIRIGYMFYGAKNIKKISAEHFDLSQATKKEGSVMNYSVFCDCTSLEDLSEIELPAGGYNYTFSNCPVLHSIGAVNIGEGDTLSNVFRDCSALENLTIKGTIGQNGFNVSYSKKLTHDSLMSIINALQTKTILTWTVTLGATNLAKLTDAEKAIATEKGWTLA